MAHGSRRSRLPLLLGGFSGQWPGGKGNGGLFGPLVSEGAEKLQKLRKEKATDAFCRRLAKA